MKQRQKWAWILCLFFCGDPGFISEVENKLTPRHWGREREVRPPRRRAMYYSVMVNSKRWSLNPVGELLGDYGCVEKHVVFMYEFITKPLKMSLMRGVTQKCQLSLAQCPVMGRNYARKKPSGRRDQPQIILFRLTKDRLIWGSDTNFPQANQCAPPPPFFLFTITN